ncbi:MAG TPA: hypothetical protein VGD63_12810, partial [Steroidobacteraceae bacterium]
MKTKPPVLAALALTAACAARAGDGAAVNTVAVNTVHNLSTSKQLLAPLPGAPRRLNSLPMGIAQSPDGRFLAILNAGYGTYESHYAQSIALLDT